MTNLRKLALLPLLAMLLGACGFDVYKMPLPGGADVGKDPMVITVEFADVLDLVPQSSVKVNDISVGRVSDVRLVGNTAELELTLRNDVGLPANAIAEIRMTSLLGEKFVSLGAPVTAPSGELADGDHIPLDRSGRNPEVEEVFGALSLLLNGGGVAQLKTISHELNLALEGREGSVRSVLRQIDEFMGTLDRNKDDIVHAIEALNRLSLQVSSQVDTIDAALAELPSALRSLDSQREALIQMLDALNELSDVGVEVIQVTKQDTVRSLELLTPVLSQFAKAGDDFIDVFHVFYAYPFVDEVVGRDPQVARNLHMGDYTNLSVQLDLDFRNGLPTLPGLPTDECHQLADLPSDGPLPNLEELCEDALNAISACLQQRTVDACAGLPNAVINQVCASVPLPGLCPTGGNGGLLDPILGGSSNGDTGGGLLDPILNLLPRAGFGAIHPERGPTYGQLMSHYHPGLVSLFVPTLVTEEAVR
ncbi:MCE family protein [Nocardioides limicola]|uniref:MCE family protein n=1 Tax=Nocardioides limicola TaxID=2803368 RepID=UPI00193C3BAB|nr:MCE family protein [Nocardioides sp. DJM-14]